MILIDLDGTLIDTAPDLAACVDEMMDRLEMPRRGEAAVRHWVGNGVPRLIKRALLNRLEGEPEQPLFDEALPIFWERYAEQNGRRSRLYPGVEEGLVALRAAGFRLGCVTNKPQQFTQPLLAQMGVVEHFDIVLCGDSLPKKKPDPLPLLYAAQALGIAPANALMLGDSENDVIAARAAGFQIVCVAYGYNHGEDVGKLNPDAVIESMADLKALLMHAA